MNRYVVTTHIRRKVSKIRICKARYIFFVCNIRKRGRIFGLESRARSSRVILAFKPLLVRARQRITAME